MKLFISMKIMFKTALHIDKKSMVLCAVYNLVKQLMNVFYGVYFIRMILTGLETKQSILRILAVLIFMFVVHVVFSKFDQYYKNIYLPIFKLKVDGYVNENIIRKANEIPYDIANSPAELDKYNRVMKNSSKMMMQAYQSFGLLCGLLEAFVLILFYIIKVDVFAILLSVFPLLYSYFLAGKSEDYKYELNKKIASYQRKQEYAKRIHYLKEYADELRTSNIGRVVEGVYKEGYEQTIEAYKSDGKRISLIAFLELLLGDAISMILPLLYLVIRMLGGAKYLMGDFIGIMQSITTFSSDVEWMLDTILELKSASLYINDYNNYIVQYEKKEKDVHMIDEDEAFRISFNHVKYRYPGSAEGIFALDDVSVDIKNGEKIAIVGENGAGKSTFVSLLVNLISCNEGNILLNGLDINSYERSELKSFFGVVCQDYQIYPMSVRDNISINGPLTDDVVVDAIRKVGLAERISNLNQLVGKEISDTGLELSGGERQRLALARVVANSYPVVVLDEPTSALDALTERNINQLVLDALRNTNRTLLFVSHKLSTTRLVDRILVFKDGRIIESGNHEELMKREGLYARMYQEQMNMYKGKAHENKRLELV